MEKEMTPVERFYQDVSDLLGVTNTYEYNKFTVGGTYLTRWNNRKPGNGRFEGFGLVRYFGPENIHVCLKHPVSVNKTFDSTDAALAHLKEVLTKPAL